MTIETLRFGTVDIDDNKLILFTEGLPGLEEYKRFAVLKYDESYPIIWLQAVDDGRICLPVVDSFAVLPDYAFNLDDADVKELGFSTPENVQVISVVVIPENIEQMTLNMAAPIIINTGSGAAKQIILTGSEFSTRYPVFNDICRLIKEGSVETDSDKEESADAGVVAKSQ